MKSVVARLVCIILDCPYWRAPKHLFDAIPADIARPRDLMNQIDASHVADFAVDH